MRRRRSNPFLGLLLVIILGAAGGLLFTLYETAGYAPQSGSGVVRLLPTAAPAQPGTNPVQPPTAQPGQSLLFIPSSGVYAPIIDVYIRDGDWDIRFLGDSIGHLQGTSKPGAAGNAVLVGHVERADGRAGIFAGLKALNPGDLVLLLQDGVERRYAVASRETVTPDSVHVLQPTPNDQLTLITCDRYDFVRGEYLERVVVVAQALA